MFTEAAAADEDRWVEVQVFGSRVLETTFEGHRYVVVFSSARERRDTARRLQLIARVETKLLPLENRVRRGDRHRRRRHHPGPLPGQTTLRRERRG